MKKFGGYDDARKKADYQGSSQIPVGAYVCKILNVKYEQGENGGSDRIAIQFDVVEGEQKDFFKNQYDSNTSDDKKWKGSTRIYVPKDDGSKEDEWAQNKFAKWTRAFEESNSGYSWDWDENKWKDKLVGIIFGQTGSVIENKEVLYTEVHGCCSVTEAKEGTFWKGYLNLKKKNGYTGDKAASSSDGFDVSIPDSVSEEEIPF